MDDCNLDKLSIKPGKLSPAFHKDTTDYSVTVGSGVEKITFDCLTSDTGASYCISGSDGGRTVPLQEGEVRDIKIEVTAEDGTVKNYIVHVHRLSAKDATLSGIKLSQGTLKPDFSPITLEYSVLLPCDVSSIGLTPIPPDPKVTLSINDVKPGTDIKLNVSQTLINIKVTSVDGSNTQVYKLYVYRKQIPRFVKLVDSSLAMKFECPVSLAPLYQPITIKDSDPRHSYSGPIIDHFTKTSKIDPLSELPLCSEWRIEDIDLDQQMSNADSFIPLTGGNSSDKVKLSELGDKLISCNKMREFENLKVKYETDAPVKHKIEVRTWEKHLQQIFDESNPTKLCTSAEASLKEYYTSLPKPGTNPVYRTEESPIDYLEHAIHCYATAIKNKPRDATLHLKLALVLEERYYVEDMYGVKRSEDKVDCFFKGKESSKAEECAAICQLHGVDVGAPLSLQLKAIDKEYQQLKENGQSAKADHVQGLCAWKSKQATQEGAAAQKASDEESILGQAYLKCMDALSLDESKAVYHFHVGRLLVIRGDFDDAVTRLEAALGWNEKHQLAKFYLGFALTLKKNGPETRAKEAVAYLIETMEILLEQQTKQALSKDDVSQREVLHAEDLLRMSNVHLLRGFIELGKLLEKEKDIKNIMSSPDIYQTAALMVSQLLPIVHKGDTYQQLEWILLDAHSLLLEHLLNTQSSNIDLIASRCQRLSALIKHSTIPQNNDILALQQKTCQMFVQIQPCNSRALYLLGNAQFEQYDNDPEADQASQLLDDAKLSFKAAIGLEGKPAAGAPTEQLTEQRWWISKQKEEEEKKKKAEEAAAKPSAAASKTGARGAPAGRGGSTARGAASRGAPAAKSGAPKGATSTGRGGGRGAATPASRGGAATRGGKAGPPPKTVQDKARASPNSSRDHIPDKQSSTSEARRSSTTSKQPPSAASQPPPTTTSEDQSTTKTTVNMSALINKKSYHPRIGLARALTKTPELVDEALKYYKEVIDLAPELHDAYIESADMVVKTDPMAAVDIYSKYPDLDELSFDDACIYGQIVHLLIKAEKYDDPRLGPSMIKLGKILGLAALEKHVEILENKYKSELLKTIYAGVNGKDIDDPDMQAFFKFKLWA